MLYQLVSKFGNRADWKCQGAHHPALSMIRNGRLAAAKLATAVAINRPPGLPSFFRANTNAGMISAGKTFAAAPNPSHVPASLSDPRENAQSPRHINSTARRSQLWKEYKMREGAAAK